MKVSIGRVQTSGWSLSAKCLTKKEQKCPERVSRQGAQVSVLTAVSCISFFQNVFFTPFAEWFLLPFYFKISSSACILQLIYIIFFILFFKILEKRNAPIIYARKSKQASSDQSQLLTEPLTKSPNLTFSSVTFKYCDNTYGASFTNVQSVPSDMTPLLEELHAWFNVCCYGLEILNHIWTRNLAFSFCTRSHKWCSRSCKPALPTHPA